MIAIDPRHTAGCDGDPDALRCETATAAGRPSNSTGTTSPEVGSIRRSAAPTWSATHSEPSPTAMPAGEDPAGSVWLTVLVSTSIRSTVPSAAFAHPDGTVADRDAGG